MQSKAKMEAFSPAPGMHPSLRRVLNDAKPAESPRSRLGKRLAGTSVGRMTPVEELLLSRWSKLRTFGRIDWLFIVQVAIALLCTGQIVWVVTDQNRYGLQSPVCRCAALTLSLDPLGLFWVHSVLRYCVVFSFLPKRSPACVNGTARLSSLGR